MSEEIYNSNDYCKLAEEFEELKKENAELARDKDHLMNLFMESSEYVYSVVSNMEINDLRQKCKRLEADYEISNRELLVKQVEITALRAELEAENEKLKAELRYTDDLLKEATETIGSVVACCTYNSDADAKIGTYGIDYKAFTKIDQFMFHYNDAVSAGKVSVDVKTSTDNNKRE